MNVREIGITVTVPLDQFIELVRSNAGYIRFREPELPDDREHGIYDRGIEVTGNISGHLRFERFINARPIGEPVFVPCETIFNLFPMLGEVLGRLRAAGIGEELKT